MAARTASVGFSLTCLLFAWTAQAGGPFAGIFVSQDGDRLVLKQNGDRITGQLHSEGTGAPVEGRIAGGKLAGQIVMPWGDRIGFQATRVGGDLRITLAGDPEVALFRRQGGTPPAAAAPGSPPSPTPALAPPAPAAAKAVRLAAKGAASKGAQHKAPYDGWSIRAPKGWKMTARGSALLLGSDSEAGLIIVRQVTERNVARLQQGLARELAATGGSFGAVPTLTRARVPGGKAVYTDLAGTAQDGSRIQLRAIGVIGPRGTVGIYGLTVPGDKFTRLRKRVDSMARSVRFFKPKTSPGRQAVVGEWFSYSSAGPTGVGGSSSTLAFCPDGRFFKQGESSYSGNAGTSEAWGVAGQHGSAGRWSARGDLRRGTIVVTGADGRRFEISYQVKKPRDGVLFNGRLHGLKGKSDLCR